MAETGTYDQVKLNKDLLVVEDNKVIQRIYQAQFEPYNMDLVVTGEAALAALLTIHYRLIVLDFGLPDINGIEICRRIRQDILLGHQHQPILMASAMGHLIEKECLQAGANSFFVKTDIASDPFREAVIEYLSSV